MSKWMQHTVELIVACVALIGVAVFYNTFQISMNGHPHHYHLRTARQVASSASAPTLYFHGLQESSRSTSHLINTAARTDGQRAMVIDVKRNGRLNCHGTINSSMRHPLVQVNFLNNVAPIKVQSQWMYRILTILKNRYHVTNYNAVAHSAGAVAVVETADRFSNHRNVPRLERFVSIAGPYDGVMGINDVPGQNPSGRNGKPQIFHHSNRWYPSYLQLIKSGRRFPKGVHVLNVYGRINKRFNADGYVTSTSARSLRYLLRGRNASYEEIPIFGRYAQNRLLDHNSNVDRIVNRFIFNE